MAYKFQLGKAVLSGSVTAEDGFDANDATLSNVREISRENGSLAIQLAHNNSDAVTFESGGLVYAKFDTETAERKVKLFRPLQVFGSTKLEFGGTTDTLGINAGVLELSGASDTEIIGATTALYGGTSKNLQVHGDRVELFANLEVSGANNLTVGGDITGSSGIKLTDASGIAGLGLANNGGALDLDGNGLTESAGSMQTTDMILFVDASNSNETRKLNLANLRNSVFAAVSGDATIATGGALTIASASVEGTMLNSNVVGNGLVMTGDALTALANPTNATITVASAGLSVRSAGSLESTPQGLAVKVSGSDPAAAGLIVDSGGIKMNSSIGGNRTFEDNVTINGNLTVVGSSVEIQTGEFVVTSSIRFEGTTPDDYEIILTSADAQGSDKTITLPDRSGDVAIVEGAVTNRVMVAEFELLRSGSTVQTALVADGDAVLFNDADAGMKQINVTSLKTYFQTGVTADTANGFAFNTYNTASAAQSLDATAGVWAVNSDDGTSSNALTLDLSGSWSNGEVVIIKAPANAETNNVTVRAVGADTVEGVSSIILESNNAAVTLIYGNTNWMIV